MLKTQEVSQAYLSTSEKIEPLLRIRGLKTHFKIKKSIVKAVNKVSLDIYRNEILALVGETGCGKSVLGLSILQLLPKNAEISGSICYNGTELLKLKEGELRKLRGKEIGVIPQSPATSLNPLMKIGQQVMEVMELHKNLRKVEAERETIHLFSRLQLPNPQVRAKDYPHQLSGGMKQRVLVSMGVACNPKLILVDEPTKGLDAVLRKEVVNILKEQTYISDSSMLLITHDFSVAAALADRIGVMYAGEIVEIGLAEEIIEHPKHPYTISLIDSLPSRGFCAIPGFSPSLSDLPLGCRFQPRCRISSSSCRNLHPDLVKIDLHHQVRCLSNA